GDSRATVGATPHLRAHLRAQGCHQGRAGGPAVFLGFGQGAGDALVQGGGGPGVFFGFGRGGGDALVRGGGGGGEPVGEGGWGLAQVGEDHLDVVAALERGRAGGALERDAAGGVDV